ncbi:Beta-ketoadipyl CoA thiolase [Pseudomonas donghuensis]
MPLWQRSRVHVAPRALFAHVIARVYIHTTGSTVTKDELRAELERQEQRYKDVYGGEVTTYAAQPDPERKPWRKRASVLDQAFAQELEKIEKELKDQAP